MTIILAILCSAMIITYAVGMLLECAPCADVPVSSLVREDAYVDTQVNAYLLYTYVPDAPAPLAEPEYELDSIRCLAGDWQWMSWVERDVVILCNPEDGYPEWAEVVCLHATDEEAAPTVVENVLIGTRPIPTFDVPVIDFEAELSLVLGVTIPTVERMLLNTPCAVEIEDLPELEFTLESGLPC